MVACGFILTVVLAPDPRPQDLSSLTMSQLVELLGSPREVVRQAAAGQIIVRGKTVAPDLALAAALASPAQLKEIMAILNELLLSSDEQVAEAAETALEQTVNSENESAADMASRVLHRNTNLRHTRALAQIVRLGGAVSLVTGNETAADDTLADETFADNIMADRPTAEQSASANEPANPPPMRIASRMIFLDRHWQGGDAGLRYVRRVGLYPGEPLSLHIADDAPVTEDALRLLRAQREKTRIRRPDDGCMGVAYSEDPNSPPVILTVFPDSPADRAGLRHGDWIAAIEGERVEQFRQVAHYAREHRPGKTLELIVRRESKEFRVTLTLGSDFGTGVCRCVE